MPVPAVPHQPTTLDEAYQQISQILKIQSALHFAQLTLLWGVDVEAAKRFLYGYLCNRKDARGLWYISGCAGQTTVGDANKEIIARVVTQEAVDDTVASLGELMSLHVYALVKDGIDCSAALDHALSRLSKDTSDAQKSSMAAGMPWAPPPGLRPLTFPGSGPLCEASRGTNAGKVKAEPQQKPSPFVTTTPRCTTPVTEVESSSVSPPDTSESASGKQTRPPTKKRRMMRISQEKDSAQSKDTRCSNLTPYPTLTPQVENTPALSLGSSTNRLTRDSRPLSSPLSAEYEEPETSEVDATDEDVTVTSGANVRSVFPVGSTATQPTSRSSCDPSDGAGLIKMEGTELTSLLQGHGGFASDNIDTEILGSRGNLFEEEELTTINTDGVGGPSREVTATEDTEHALSSAVPPAASTTNDTKTRMTVITSRKTETVTYRENGYLVVEDTEKIERVTKEVPIEHERIPVAKPAGVLPTKLPQAQSSIKGFFRKKP